MVRQLSSWNPCAWLCSVRGVWWVRPVLLLVLLHAWLPSWVSASPSIVPHSPVCNEDQPWKIMLRFLFFIYYQKDFVLGSFSILYQSQIQTLAVWNTYNGVNLVEACIYTHTYWGHSLKPWHFFLPSNRESHERNQMAVKADVILKHIFCIPLLTVNVSIDHIRFKTMITKENASLNY